MKKKKVSAFLLFSLMSMLLGAIVGVIIWIMLKLMNLGIEIIWSNPSLPFNLIVCSIGAILIGLWQRRNGILPDDTEEVIEIVKKNGSYPYDRVGVICLAVLMPLIFGGALGPEAGLVGVISALCCWVGDSLKKRADTLVSIWNSDDNKTNATDEVMSETGIATVLGVVFGSPLMGIVGNLEPNGKGEKAREKILKKKGRIFIYCMGVLGALGAIKGCSTILIEISKLSNNEFFIEFAQEGGLPRFEARTSLDFSQWKWALLMLCVGIALGFIYCTFELLTKKIASLVKDYRIISCLIAGICVAVIGYFLPNTMFSGEHAMKELLNTWQGVDPFIMILTAVLKLALVSICISFGWRGGDVFPIIFSGMSVALGISLLVGANGAFASAILISSMYSYINRKPFSVVAILLLCFPLGYIPPMLIAAYISSKIPSPFVKTTLQQQ